MQNGKAVESGVELLGVIVPRANLPQYVFSRKFERHLFFDADIGSSDALISAVKEIAVTCFGVHFRAAVFACSDRTLLGWLDAEEDWLIKINKISKAMRDSGDWGGLILVEATQRWVVYQDRPVDVGVFAFDSNQDLQGIATIVNDNFFDRQDIAGWLSGRTQRDIDLIDNLGHDYLIALMENYL